MESFFDLPNSWSVSTFKSFALQNTPTLQATLQSKLVRLLSYFSWNIHSIHLTPVNENLSRHWFSVAINRSRSRTVYCTIDLVTVYDAILTISSLGDPGAVSRVGIKAGTKVLKYGRGLKIGMDCRDLAPNCSKARRSTKKRAVLWIGSWRNYVIITRLERKLWILQTHFEFAYFSFVVIHMEVKR